MHRTWALPLALGLFASQAAAQPGAVYPLTVTVIAGGTVADGPTPGLPTGEDGTGLNATFLGPVGLAADNSGNIWVADTSDHTIRKIAPGGVVTTVAGQAGMPGSSDGTGGAAHFHYPEGIAFDPTSGNFYIADAGNCTIRRLTPEGVVTTVAGTPGVQGVSDGTGGAGQFWSPMAIAMDSSGNAYVGDGTAIRLVTPGGVVTTIAGQPGTSGTADGAGTAAQFNAILGLAFDSDGNLYAADTNRVRKMTPEAVVSTVAGQVQAGFADGEGSSAQFNLLGGIAVDAQGDLLVTDEFSNAIREITPAGLVITVAGGPHNPAPSLTEPAGIAIDFSGTIWFTGGDSVWTAARDTAAPGLIGVPSSQTATGGSNVTLSVNAASSGALTYQWYQNGSALADGGAISGATGATLVITNAQAANAGAYWVSVANAAGEAVATVDLTIGGPPPVITAQPAPQTATAGAPATFSVGVNSGLTPSYQWQFDGTNIPGATGASYTVASASAANIGLYSVVVTNADGKVTSSAALLSVNPAQPVTPLYSLTDLGTLGGPNSYAYGINASGTVVGSSDTGGGTTDPFVYAYGEMSDLTAGTAGTAYAINDSGEIVGTTGNTGQTGLDAPHAFYTTGGAVETIPVPAMFTTGLGSNGVATGVNDSGAVAVTFYWDNNVGGVNPEAYLLDNQGLHWIGSASVESWTGGINASGQVAGAGSQGPPFSAFPGTESLPEAGGYGEIFTVGGPFSIPLTVGLAINTAGEVAGTNGLQAAYWNGSQVVILGTLPGDDSSLARGINDAGVVVGDSENESDVAVTHAFVSLNGQLLSLSQLATLGNGSSPGLVSLDSARAINDAGQIVGWGTYYNGTASVRHAFLLTPIAGRAIVGMPASQTAAAGQTVTLSAAATGAPSGYQWYDNGSPISGATGPTLVLSNIATNQAGTYSAVVSWGAASQSSTAATVTVNADAHLANVSALAFAGPGSQALAAGFVISGSAAKRVLLRGAGPSLAGFNLSDVLADPQLTLFDSSPAVIASDAGWGNNPAAGPSAAAAQISAATAADFSQVFAFAFPAGSADSALTAVLPAGVYSAQVAGENGSSGAALAEVYDEDGAGSPSRLINLSARAPVGAGARTLIAGFIVAGSSSETVLIRAVGPALAAAPFNMPGPLAEPALTLFDNQQQVIATNAGWAQPPAAGNSSVAAGLQPATAAIMAQVGAFALAPGSADSAMVVTLRPGSYSAQVSGVGGDSGIALVEIYEVP